MAYTRRQVVTIISFVYLILVTALSGYASSVAKQLHLPIPDILSGLTSALPIVAGLLLEAGYDLNRAREQRQGNPNGSTPRPLLVVIANTIIFIYSTAVITLLGTHAAPSSGLNCGLEERWKTLFTHKRKDAISTIQQSLKCCGFINTHDRAWPFPDKSHDIHACETAFGFKTGCLIPWKAEEQRISGIFMAVVGLVFVWQIAIISTPTRRETWLHRVLPDRISRLIADEEQGDNRPRRAIDYLPTSDRYRDNMAEAEEVDDSDDEAVTRRAIENSANNVGNILTGSIRTEERHITSHENAWARSD